MPHEVCWNCGTRSPDPASGHCGKCHESLVPPALAVTFDGDVVTVHRGESVLLGRSAECRWAGLFRGYLNVSRRHAHIRVDEQGRAFVEAIPDAPNGTFINDREVYTEAELGSGQIIRLAASLNGVVRFPASTS